MLIVRQAVRSVKTGVETQNKDSVDILLDMVILFFVSAMAGLLAVIFCAIINVDGARTASFPLKLYGICTASSFAILVVGHIWTLIHDARKETA